MARKQNKPRALVIGRRSKWEATINPRSIAHVQAALMMTEGVWATTLTGNETRAEKMLQILLRLS